MVSLDQRIAVREKDRVGGNGLLFEFGEGLEPTLLDLMTIMIVISDNMATNLVMEAVGIDRIREFLELSGLGVIRAERKMLDPEAVSYTHLDVYKRQDVLLSCRRFWLRPLINTAYLTL